MACRGFAFAALRSCVECRHVTLLTPHRCQPQVRKAIADILESEEDYDDGSLGPVFVRLAWHASGTFEQFGNTGGSNGATMRFAPECNHGANAGACALCVGERV